MDCPLTPANVERVNTAAAFVPAGAVAGARRRYGRRQALRGCLASPGEVVGVGPSLRPHVSARQNRSLGERPGGRWRQAGALLIRPLMETS